MSKMSEEIVAIKKDIEYIKNAVDRLAGLPERVTKTEDRLSNVNLFQTFVSAVSGVIAVWLSLFLKEKV